MTDLLTTYVAKVARKTDYNDHNGAVTEMVEYVIKKHNQLDGVESLRKATQSLEELHRFYGFMPAWLIQVREDIRSRCHCMMTHTESLAFRKYA